VQCRYLIDKETSTLIPTRSAFEADDNVRPQMEKLGSRENQRKARTELNSAPAERLFSLKAYGFD
jgi:hypothetical protein